jgi:hypothetical protein
MIKPIQSINIENVPDNFEEILDRLKNDSSDLISVYKDEEFGQYLVSLGYEFTKSWEWIVVFR